MPGDESDEYCASLICDFRFDTDLADEYIIIHRQSSRDERNAREAHGNYIINNVKEESTEYMDPAKFNHKINVSLQFVEQLHIEPTSEVNNFEGAPHEADWKNGNSDGASEKTAVGIDLGTTYSCVGM